MILRDRSRDVDFVNRRGVLLPSSFQGNRIIKGVLLKEYTWYIIRHDGNIRSRSVQAQVPLVRRWASFRFRRWDGAVFVVLPLQDA